MSTRKNFSFRYEWSEKIAHLSEKVQYQILMGTVAYARTGEFPAEASAEAREAFEEFILPDFLKRAKAAEYRARAKARKTAADAGRTPESTLPAPSQESEVPMLEKTAEDKAPRPAAVPFRLSRAERRRRDRELKKKRRVNRFA